MLAADLSGKLLKAVDAGFDAQVAFLADLTRFPSTRGQEAPAQDFMAAAMAKRGLVVCGHWRTLAGERSFWGPWLEWAHDAGLVVGAPAAAVPHVLKSGLRVASTATTGGLLNPVVSLIEDALALAMVMLAVVVPIVAAILVSVLAIWGARRLARLTQRASAPHG